MPTTDVANLAPVDAAAIVTAELVIGSGARLLVEARGSGEAREGWPSAADAMKVCEQLRTLAPRPLYGRAPMRGSRKPRDGEPGCGERGIG